MTDQVPALVVDARDNVATLLKPGAEGQVVEAGENKITLRQNIEFGHKVAIRSIHSGDVVIKYGSPIGIANRDIEPGEHVHVHNVIGHRQELRGREYGQK